MAEARTRRAVIGMGSGLAAAAISACGAAGGEAPGAPSKQPATVQVLTVRVGAFAQPLKEIGEVFTRKTPHVTVDWRNYGEGGPGVQALTLAGAGQLFDIVNFGVVTTGPLAARGALLGLNALIGREKYDLKDFWPWCVDGVKWKGDVYALHNGNNANLLFYNKNLFSSSGVAPPTKDWSWDQLLEAAKRLTRRSGSESIYGFATATASYATRPWIQMHGGDVMDQGLTRSLVDQPKAREALQWLADLNHKHRVWPQADDLKEVGAANVLQLFTTGRLAMWYDGLWNNDSLVKTPPVFQYDMVEAPRGAAGRSGFFHQGPFHIGKDTKVPDQTFTFLAWLASAEGQREYLKRIPGGTPSRRSVGKELASVIPPAALATMEYSKDYPLHPELDKLDAAYVQGLNPVWRGEVSVQSATETIAREQTRILGQTPK